ncbi:AAA+ ATPase domain-containing protein [Artemisia annua]|uniref:AAA+ ATPase domain-containing protein n=1 Tax=Artemisia annua TaxID=35608 RepID=A0A2U1N3A2_ARTAN|nr:AAA+ ATPase domain-containing protein [Artemisia annua]
MSDINMWDMTQIGSLIAGVMFLSAILQQLQYLRPFLMECWHTLVGYFKPYISIVFPEHQGRWNKRSKAYKAIELYLTTIAPDRAKHLRASDVKKCKNVVLSMDEYEDVIDEFKGIKIKWSSRATEPTQQIVLSSYGAAPERRRYYQLTCHRKHREFIIKYYISHVIEEGKAIAKNTRRQKLYTNCGSENYYEETRSMWCDILFEHPSTFDTLAMDPRKKNKILNDLMMFKGSKDYYKKAGKTWKRGYLLYGPPGTGKSSMIAAMANLLEYDIYDLELTSVKDNMELRRLLIDTTSKSLIVIEDIDCSLDLTGTRKEEKEQKSDQEDEDIIEKKDKKKRSELTLSGLLNSVDGLWSACGSEKIIVFTTNHVDKLDPALIRRGRMDMHIELSYCCFEAFKVLAKNYLNIESHELFATIDQLLKETNMTPADVAENLMPKSVEDNADTCLNNLIKCLENAKEEARLKAMKEASNENGEKVQDDQEVMKKSSNKSEEDGEKVQDDEELSEDQESSDSDDNMELRRLLIDTTSKSLIVIEDIDCSLDLTGTRKEEKEQKSDQEDEDIIEKKDKKKRSELTLSGLLNSVDGLWSACGSEKIIVFTTNHVDKLDPALIRRGRMDMHIELSYCCFEAFKVLAKNYLNIESHELFATIDQLLKETNMTPADVAENLMPKSVEDNADTCLNNLIKCLENAKEEARLKAMKEASNENGEKVQDDQEVMKKSSNKSEEDGEKVQDDEELSEDQESSDSDG